MESRLLLSARAPARVTYTCPPYDESLRVDIDIDEITEVCELDDRAEGASGSAVPLAILCDKRLLIAVGNMILAGHVWLLLK